MLEHPAQTFAATSHIVLPDLQGIYKKHQYRPEENEFRFFSGGHLDPQKLSILSENFSQINLNITEKIQEELGSNHLLTTACKIGTVLTKPVNELFREMVIERQEKRFSHSWRTVNPVLVETIREVTQSIFEHPSFSKYFLISPEAKEILYLFVTDLANEKSYTKRLQIFNQIDELSASLYSRGLPTWIIPESTYYTQSYGVPTEDSCIPEPTLRLIVPDADVLRNESVEKDIWTYLCSLHGNSHQRSFPNIFTGWQVMTMGSDIPSLSSVEWLNERSILFLLDSFKSIPVIERIAQDSGILISRESIIRTLYYIYRWHELGHAFFNLLDRTCEELDTDLTTLVGVMKFASIHGIKQEDLLLCLLGEYGKQSAEIPSINPVIDGYRKSGKYIVSVLFEQGFVTRQEGKYVFHIGKKLEDKKILADHAGIHVMDPLITTRLKAL